jgi:hypothetical protein
LPLNLLKVGEGRYGGRGYVNVKSWCGSVRRPQLRALQRRKIKQRYHDLKTFQEVRFIAHVKFYQSYTTTFLSWVVVEELSSVPSKVSAAKYRTFFPPAKST